MSRLLEQYNNQIKQDLKSKLELKNTFEVPPVPIVAEAGKCSCVWDIK